MKMVGTRGFEPPTSAPPAQRATRLRYIPKIKMKKKFIAVGLPPQLYRFETSLSLEEEVQFLQTPQPFDR